jgi:hypothetical protein
LGYVIQAGSSTNLGPADNQTYYYGCSPSIAATNSAATATGLRCYVPHAGTITAAYLNFWVAGTLSTAEASQVSLRVNGTTLTALTSSVTTDAVATVSSATGLSIPVAQGDYVQILWTTPIWATNPTNVRLSATLYVQ